MNETGGVPPGNAKGNTTWSIRRSAPKPELKLTPGKGLQDLTCSVEDLVDQVVKTNKVLQKRSHRLDILPVDSRAYPSRLDVILKSTTSALHELSGTSYVPWWSMRSSRSAHSATRSCKIGRRPLIVDAHYCRWWHL